MPEGPSLVILRELLEPFEKKKILAASGNTKIDLEPLVGQTLQAVDTWGKHLLLRTKAGTIRIHLLMFGTYRIDERKPDATPRLSLGFARGREINFYTCAVKWLEDTPEAIYDWSADVMSDAWSPRKARNKLAKTPDALVCDVLLDQQVFSGVGNIIRNEVAYRTRIHPESRIGALPSRKLGELIREARNYTFDFLDWKRENTLRRHWLAHKQNTCKRCQLPMHKAYPGHTKRRAFFCPNCQLRYD